MEKVPRGKRASENQKEYLINYLEENIDLANYKFVTIDGAKYRDEKWRELSANLNALGGTQKDGSKWKKYWSDLRLHTRAKYSAIKQAEQKSGVNGMSRLKHLTALEERVIKITTVEAVDGDNTEDMGFEALLDTLEQPLEEFVVVDCEIDILASTLANIPNDSSTISGASTSAAAVTAGVSTSRPQRRKRRALPERHDVENLYNIEEKKLDEMKIANDLKRQKIEILKEHTNVVRADTQDKEIVVAKLQDLINVLKERH